MSVQVNRKVIVAAVVIAAVGFGVFYYIKTSPIRLYRARNEEMRLIAERQQLEIDIYNQGNQLAQIQQRMKQAQQQLQEQTQQWSQIPDPKDVP